MKKLYTVVWDKITRNGVVIDHFMERSRSKPAFSEAQACFLVKKDLKAELGQDIFVVDAEAYDVPVPRKIRALIQADLFTPPSS